MKGRKGRRTPGHSGDTDWTIDRARRNTGRLTQNNLLLVKLLFFDEKKNAYGKQMDFEGEVTRRGSLHLTFAV